MALIEFNRLTKQYGAVTAVDDLTFSLLPGTVTGFVGANGAGKSTTMRMLLGLTRQSAGAATIDGRPYAELPEPIRHVGAMVEPGVFHPNRSGRNALRVIARRRHPVQPRRRAARPRQLERRRREAGRWLLHRHAPEACTCRRPPGRSLDVDLARARQWPRPTGRPLAARTDQKDGG